MEKKEFVLQGLSCANCAIKIEAEVDHLEEVTSATVSFATTTLQVNTTHEYTEHLHQKVEKIIHRHEPDILVVEKNKESSLYRELSHTKVIWLVSGTLAFFIGWVIHYFINVDWDDLTFTLFAFSYLLLGTKVLIRMVKNMVQGKIFDENFLMGIATIGAFIIGEYAGATAVMVFYQVGEFFQDLAVQKSKKNLAELMDIRPDYANLQRRDDKSSFEKVMPEQVEIGDIIMVKAGEKIPLDGVVIEGVAMLDTSALTGESVPHRVKVSDSVLSGCLNQNGALLIKTTKHYGESTVSKIIDLVENASSKKAPTETFITKFASYYTPVVVLLGVLIALIPPLFFGGDWYSWVYRSLIFLVISCPCALVLSVPLGFFSGIGGASKKGILVKGGNYLEALANLDTVVFDKTGTLTKGVFKVTTVEAANGFTNDELLVHTAHAEFLSNHPIALSVLQAYNGTVDKENLSEYEEIAGHGISVKSNGKKILAGNEKLMNLKGIDFSESPTHGTKVYVAVDHVYAGCIIISDEIKSDSKQAIETLKAWGVRKTVMLTGDTPLVARAVADELGIDELHASLLPGQKVEKVEQLNKEKDAKKTLAFVGDGINDAPVLAIADVGVSMGGLGSDVAIEASDVVLMTDEPLKLAEAVKISRFTRRIVWQNIILTLIVQVIFLALGMMGIASIWEAVFADVGVSLIAVFNSRRILKY